MMFGAFQNRSGRVISLGRVLLATVFLLAIWLDPSQPALAPTQAYTILILYVLISAGLFAATWENWWLDVKLALPAHILDVAVFSLMVFLTEGYTSPFFTFFVFLLLSATIRWGWRETAITAGVVILLFYVAGTAALQWSNGEFDRTRFLIRGTYLVVLSLILIWFGINQRGRRRDRRLLEQGTSAPGIEPALRHVAAHTRAGRLVFAWWENEEPWINVARLEDGSFTQTRHGPTEFGDIVDPHIQGKPFLFDAGAARTLAENGGRPRTLPVEHSVDGEFARRFGVQRGLAIPVATDQFGGEIFALDVPGLCADDLAVAARLSAEISSALERSSNLALSEQGAETRTRLALARDLHDSVVQLLAGTSFRLQAIKNAAIAGQDVSSDIDALQQELSREQKELRSFISELRRKRVSPNSDITAGVPKLAERLSRQWGIVCELEPYSKGIPGSVALEHDLHQLIREGVANAVRHGGAQRVVISLRADAEEVHLHIADSGTGFQSGTGDGSHHAGPWSLSERVRSLGGSLAVRSSNQGSRVMVTLPLAPGA